MCCSNRNSDRDFSYCRSYLSIDGGAFAAYPAGGYTLASGAHTIASQNASGCTSAITNITINAAPAGPAAPTVTTVDPTCAVPTGTATVTSATAGLTFSVDGGAFAAYPAGGYTLAKWSTHNRCTKCIRMFFCSN